MGRSESQGWVPSPLLCTGDMNASEQGTARPGYRLAVNDK